MKLQPGYLQHEVHVWPVMKAFIYFFVLYENEVSDYVNNIFDGNNHVTLYIL